MWLGMYKKYEWAFDANIPAPLALNLLFLVMLNFVNGPFYTQLQFKVFSVGKLYMICLEFLIIYVEYLRVHVAAVPLHCPVFPHLLGVWHPEHP